MQTLEIDGAKRRWREQIEIEIGIGIGIAIEGVRDPIAIAILKPDYVLFVWRCNKSG